VSLKKNLRFQRHLKTSKQCLSIITTLQVIQRSTQIKKKEKYWLTKKVIMKIEQNNSQWG